MHPQQAAIVKQYPHQRNNGKRKYAPMQEDMLVQCVFIGTHSFVKNLTIKSSKKKKKITYHFSAFTDR